MLKHLMMANAPNLKSLLIQELQTVPGESVHLSEVRKFVSCPKLADFYVRGNHGHCLVAVGDTFLESRTMLADRAHPSFALPLQCYEEFLIGKEVVREVGRKDGPLTRIELWPFNPGDLSPDQFVLAIALSYLPHEYRMDERLAIAVESLLCPLGFTLGEEP